MKKIIILFICIQLNAQENTPKKLIDDFFIAFHQKDTLTLKKICHQDVVLQTIVTNKNQSKLQTEKFVDFLKNIASIPKEMIFLEKILDYKIEIDGDLAHVWTPYEFYINQKINHIGANSFTLIFVNNHWKIIHLVDTRRKKLD
jgi:hypothetical protein